MSHSYRIKYEHPRYVPMASMVCTESLSSSLSNVVVSRLIFVMAAVPLLVWAACDTDEGFKGRVMYRTTVTFL